MTIEVIVTFPEDKHQVGMKMHMSKFLYDAHEIPAIIEDTMKRSARAINRKIEEERV